MWHWRRKNEYKRYALWAKLALISSLGHGVVLLLFFVFYHEPTTALAITVPCTFTHKNNAVLMVERRSRVAGSGVQKKTAPKGSAKGPGVVGGKNAKSSVTKPIAMPSPAQKKLASQKIPVLQKALVKNDVKMPEKNTVKKSNPGEFKRATTVASVPVTPKKIESAPVKVSKPVVDVPKVAKIAELPKPVEVPKAVVSQVKASVPAKKPANPVIPLPKEPVVPAPMPVIPEPVIPDSVAQRENEAMVRGSLRDTPHSAHGPIESANSYEIGQDIMVARDEHVGGVVYGVTRYDLLRQEVGSRWQPPIGVMANSGCTVRIRINNAGKADTLDMVSGSGVLMFDISVQTVCHTQQWPAWVHGKELTITFS